MTVFSATALIQRAQDHILAQRIDRRVSVAEFSAAAKALAARLPNYPYAINLCRDRYRFLLGFCAVILRGQCNLLPASRQPAAQADAAARYAPGYVLHDDAADPAPGIASFRWPSDLDTASGASPLPDIPSNQLAAVAFTSGSTGASGANPKTWHMLAHGTQTNVRYILDEPGSACELLATVPGQHMYGLETSILAPLFANVCVHSGQPLFPDDVRAALERMRSPRILVSTPLHLRALQDTEIAYPPVELILSATAPLATDLARAVEKRFGGRVREIYGCSEAGSIARREPSRDRVWEAFDIFDFLNHEDGVTISASHLPEPVLLQDRLEFRSPGRFLLTGRRTDLVNVAGKRGSLTELTALLLAVPGVFDAVVFQPDANDAGRLAALVVAPGLRDREVTARLREKVDPALVPRPIIHVPALPRSETGKLPNAPVMDIYRAARKAL